jgi:hypothetical protein
MCCMTRKKKGAGLVSRVYLASLFKVHIVESGISEQDHLDTHSVQLFQDSRVRSIVHKQADCLASERGCMGISWLLDLAHARCVCEKI